jgi:hypothetical protein
MSPQVSDKARPSAVLVPAGGRDYRDYFTVEFEIDLHMG